MMAIINGKRYNTDAAELCGIVDNDLEDDNWVNEMLFQKRTGEFFLVRNDSSTNFNETIIPLNFEEAYNWGFENLSDEDLDRFFHPEKLDSKIYKPLSIRMTEQCYGLIKLQSAKEERAMPEVLNDIIVNALLPSNITEKQ